MPAETLRERIREMNILVCNAGSTSLKFKVFAMPEERELAEGKIERIGSKADSIFQYGNLARGERICREGVDVPDYRTGIELFLQELLRGPLAVLERVEDIQCVGFKTVLSKGHFGVHLLDEETIKGMEEWFPIAPAHNGPYLEAVATMRRFFSTQPFVGAFETAFHQTIPLERRLYGAPYEWYERYGIQRMGYHGASHSYVASRLRELMGESFRAVSCHLGGSASVCAIQDGKSVDTSFGMSLQTGLIHANRTGDLDWGLLDFLEMQGLDREEIRRGLNKEGGLLGISGVSNDLRYIQQAAQQGNKRAELAIRVFVTGIVRYVGAFAAEMGGLDCLAFTGIGENSSLVRELVCRSLGHLGVELDGEKNQANAPCISRADARARVLVIPANEELIVARQSYQALEG